MEPPRGGRDVGVVSVDGYNHNQQLGVCAVKIKGTKHPVIVKVDMQRSFSGVGVIGWDYRIAVGGRDIAGAATGRAVVRHDVDLASAHAKSPGYLLAGVAQQYPAADPHARVQTG